MPVSTGVSHRLSGGRLPEKAGENTKNSVSLPWIPIFLSPLRWTAGCNGMLPLSATECYSATQCRVIMLPPRVFKISSTPKACRVWLRIHPRRKRVGKFEVAESLRFFSKFTKPAARRHSEQSRVELAGNGRSELNLVKQGVAWIQDVVAFLGNDDAGHGEDRAAGCGGPCVSNGLG